MAAVLTDGLHSLNQTKQNSSWLEHETTYSTYIVLKCELLIREFSGIVGGDVNRFVFVFVWSHFWKQLLIIPSRLVTLTNQVWSGIRGLAKWNL